MKTFIKIATLLMSLIATIVAVIELTTAPVLIQSMKVEAPPVTIKETIKREVVSTINESIKQRFERFRDAQKKKRKETL